MKSAKLRLALVAVVLLGWIAWLGYLALPTTTSRDVLSHAQFLESTLDVIAQVNADSAGNPEGSVVVQEVHWPKAAESLVGKTLTVINLPKTRDEGWHGADLYILPLLREGMLYQVARVPRSPGYEGSSPRSPAVRIYAATAVNRK